MDLRGYRLERCPQRYSVLLVSPAGYAVLELPGMWPTLIDFRNAIDSLRAAPAPFAGKLGLE